MSFCFYFVHILSESFCKTFNGYLQQKILRSTFVQFLNNLLAVSVPHGVGRVLSILLLLLPKELDHLELEVSRDFLSLADTMVLSILLL